MEAVSGKGAIADCYLTAQVDVAGVINRRATGAGAIVGRIPVEALHARYINADVVQIGTYGTADVDPIPSRYGRVLRVLIEINREAADFGVGGAKYVND